MRNRNGKQAPHV